MGNSGGSIKQFVMQTAEPITVTPHTEEGTLDLVEWM